MTSGDELLSCPFCGGAAEVREWDFPYVRFQARCVECKTTGRTRFNERAKAIAAWNRRTPPTPAADANPFVGTNWQVRADTPATDTPGTYGTMTPTIEVVPPHYPLATDAREVVARALCEARIRTVRRHDTKPEDLEAMLPASIDYSWRDFVAEADAALSALAPIRAAEILAAEREREAFAERVFRHGFSDGWTANQKGRLAASASVDEAWHFYVADGALQKSVALTANHSAPVVEE